jgi:hypothetical protein
MKKIIVTGIAGAAVAATLGFAAPAQAACSYFGDDAASHREICGVPDLATTVGNARTNLQNNFSPERALENLKDNLDPGKAVDNLKGNLGLG